MNNAEILMKDDAIALVARALAHPARVKIVRLLAGQDECRGAEVFSELPLAQSTISEHLRVLKDAGLVISHAVGTSMVYCLVPDVLGTFISDVVTITTSALECGPKAKEC